MVVTADCSSDCRWCWLQSLRLSADAQRAGAVGEAVSMMAVDCQRVQDVMSYTWMVWSLPLQVRTPAYVARRVGFVWFLDALAGLDAS